MLAAELSLINMVLDARRSASVWEDLAAFAKTSSFHESSISIPGNTYMFLNLDTP